MLAGPPPCVLFVVDTMVLTGDVAYAVRAGRETALLGVMRSPYGRVLVSREVWDEVPRHLGDRAASPLEEAAFRVCWTRDFASHITVVDVPSGWGSMDKRVQYTARSGPEDLGTARLASATGAMCLSADHSLTDTGLAEREWLACALSSASAVAGAQAQEATALAALLALSVLGEAMRVIARLPIPLAFGAGALLGAGLGVWARSDSAASAARLGIVALHALSRLDDEARLVATRSVEYAGTADEAIACALAWSRDSLSASELSEATGLHVSTVYRRLSATSAFSRTGDGWRLGRVTMSDVTPTLTPSVIAHRLVSAGSWSRALLDPAPALDRPSGVRS